MTTQIKAQPVNRERVGVREVLLAGIGAASLLRKNAGRTLTEATAIAGRLPESASILIEGAGERSRATLKEIGARGNAFRWEFERLARVFREEASTRTAGLVADVGARVQPLIDRIEGAPLAFGIVLRKPAKARPARRTAAKGARKTARPVAKKPAARSPRKARKSA